MSFRCRNETHADRPNVWPPLAKRGHVQMDDLQTIEEILAELAGANEFREVSVGRGDDPNVNLASRITAHRLDFAVFKESQQQRLHAEAHLADFVEKQRPAVRQQHLAHLVAKCAGEAALDVPEQLGLQQRLGQSRAVDRNILGLTPLRVVMNVVRKDILADPGFSRDQNFGVTCGRALCELEQLAHCGTGDNERTRFCITKR